jgi:hypothetical protein
MVSGICVGRLSMFVLVRDPVPMAVHDVLPGMLFALSAWPGESMARESPIEEPMGEWRRMSDNINHLLTLMSHRACMRSSRSSRTLGIFLPTSPIGYDHRNDMNPCTIRAKCSSATSRSLISHFLSLPTLTASTACLLASHPSQKPHLNFHAFPREVLHPEA